MVSTYQQPYREAFLNLINYIQDMNLTIRPDLILNQELMTWEPLGNSTFSFPQVTNLQKESYWVMTNGVRSLRVRT